MGRLVFSGIRTPDEVRCWRAGVPEEAASDLALEDGPVLFEQKEYAVYVKSKSSAQVALVHRDPVICRDLVAEEGGAVLHGSINFGSDVGYSDFELRVGGTTEARLLIEVVPTKLDYRTDYQELLAEVQGHLLGLALDYLRPTETEGAPTPVERASDLEWVLLLRHLVDDLERSLEYVNRHPTHGLTRYPLATPVARIARVNSEVRSAVRRGAGFGPLEPLFGGAASVRRRLNERRAVPTLDTPEHRWLAAQIRGAAQRLARVKAIEGGRAASARHANTAVELDTLSRRLARLLTTDVLASADGPPPAGFASTQLFGAPGYREASRACVALSLGLRLEGGPLSVSVKELAVLYEYWCYLTVVTSVARIVGHRSQAADLFRIEQQGLRVVLQRGKTCAARWALPGGRHISVTYNPTFDGEANLLPQRPDVVIALDNPGWPRVYLLIDAKYRVDTSPQYRQRYGLPGPPEDALNVLHRYRDAIVDSDFATSPPRAKRTVVQAIAAYPYRPSSTNEFLSSRLAHSLDRIGIGAIPMLPGSISFLDAWLRQALQAGGWALADRAIPDTAHDRALEWRAHASEAVLIGVLRGENPAEHLDWIARNHSYYTPLRYGRTRQLSAKHVALYSSQSLRKRGGVTHVGRVAGYSIVRRNEIATPWPSKRPDERHVLFTLDSLTELASPILNVPGKSGRGQRVSGPRWTSLLGLRRARSLPELLLETEPEWRLYEALEAAHISFDVRADAAREQDPKDPVGRAWFCANHKRAQFRGSAGFMTETAESTVFLNDVEAVLRALGDVP